MTEQAMIAPRIETERLILREFRREDFDAFCAMLADPGVTRFMGGVLDRVAAWDKFARVPGYWVLLGFGFWMIEEKASGRILGNLGFSLFERDIQPALPDIPEGGWVFDRAAHGKGFASEALAAALAWGDANLPNRGYCCIIAPENTASLELAKKFGFAETGRASMRGAETVVLERPPF
ncbi:GNAT family N-acetyltransferase [Parasphingopyxis marina]|nr:GNAT family N-acetyltransferase [Parasphingopyxis marina]